MNQEKIMKNNSTLSGLIWCFAERCGAQGVGFIVSVILARKLSPEIYGTVAIVNVIISFIEVFIDKGMGSALVQKKDADDLDFSSLFYFNLIFSIILFLIVCVCARPIANIYNMPQLQWLIPVSGIQLIIAGIKNLQIAYVEKTLQFNLFFKATTIGTIIAGIVGVSLAFLGYGPWALVIQGIVNTSIDTIFLWFTVKWRPKYCFSFIRLISLLNFGYKILLSSLINTGYARLRTILIGGCFTSSELGIYNRSESLPAMFINNIMSSINRVIFPVLCKVQDNKIEVKHTMRKMIVYSSFIIMPIMMGLAICAEPLVRLLFTDKWLPCVPYIRVFCFSFSFYSIHTSNLNAIKAIGRSDLFLKLEILKKIIGIIIIIITIQISVWAMAVSVIFSSCLSQLINSWPNKKLLNYSYCEQLKDILPNLLLSLIMGISIYPIIFLKCPDIITLLLQFVIGVIIYVSLATYFRYDALFYIYHKIKNMLKNISFKNS